jgi:hypothetical protein
VFCACLRAFLITCPSGIFDTSAHAFALFFVVKASLFPGQASVAAPASSLGRFGDMFGVTGGSLTGRAHRHGNVHQLYGLAVLEGWPCATTRV